MAIKFKELNDRLEKSPLSDKELAAIDKLEAFIDAQILERYNGNELRFSLYQAQFKRTINDKGTDWPDARRNLMFVELTKRFSDAGWKCEVEIADSQDRFGQDYWKLTGNK